MPQFIIERNIEGASTLSPDELADIAAKSNEAVAGLDVPYLWITSYVAGDKFYCVHETENADTVRDHARAGGVPRRSHRRDLSRHRPPHREGEGVIRLRHRSDDGKQITVRRRRITRLCSTGLMATSCIVPAAGAMATGTSNETAGLVQQVRDATAAFRDVNDAIAAGFTSLGACVSGPEEGAMAIHYGGPFTNDGVLRADQPDLLMYEMRDGRLRLVGVENLQETSGWTGPPPVLAGQQFQFVNAPNRYGLGAFYELHVWAWKANPKGTFADWNPRVSCDDYTGEPGTTHGH